MLHIEDVVANFVLCRTNVVVDLVFEVVLRDRVLVDSCTCCIVNVSLLHDLVEVKLLEDPVVLRIDMLITGLALSAILEILVLRLERLRKVVKLWGLSQL